MLYIKDGKTYGRCIQNLTAEEQDRLYGPPVSKLNSEEFHQRINTERRIASGNEEKKIEPCYF